MRMSFTIFLFCCTVCAMFLQCTDTQVAGGGTIETTNGIVGVICNSDTKPAANTIVKLFPDDFNPFSDSASMNEHVDTTDNYGRYDFSRLTSGRYVVIARDKHTSTNCITRDIVVHEDSLTTVSASILDKPGLITATLPKSAGTDSYLYIPGTDIISKVNSDGSVSLTDVPSGKIASIILVTAGSSRRNILRNEITALAGDTETIVQPLEKYSCRIWLNTTAEGADVSGDVYNFPVLVRLDNSNFDFSQACADGRDIVFTNGEDRVFHHQIERWSNTVKKAEIWLNVDTIHGNDSDQTITMYWGNETAAIQKENKAVFDTSNDFEGVWHLGDSTPDHVNDVTYNGYYGFSPDTAVPNITEGVIGNCRQFDGTGTYITMPNTASGKLDFAQNGHYSLSVWAKADTLTEFAQTVVSKGQYEYFIWLKYSLWQFSEYQDVKGWDLTSQNAATGQWVLLTGVRDGKKQLLYVNGKVTDTIELHSNSGPRNSISDFIIGQTHNASDSCFFSGLVDEVRVESTVRSSDWVKLCYMNQRADNRLVHFH